MSAAIRPLVSAKPDLADMPVQHAAAPRDAAGARARFFNSGNAFDLKLPPVPAASFREEAASALAPGAPSGLVACDQATALAMPGPATTPLMLARYLRLAPDATLATAFRATGTIAYAIAGEGRADVGSETLGFSAGDVMLLPGGPVSFASGRAGAVLWLVTDEPLLAFEGAGPAGPAESTIRPVHYPAAEITRQIALMDEASPNATTSGLALIFSCQAEEARRNIMPSLTLSLNTLPPGETQRAHRHNSAAITLAVAGRTCFSTVDGARVDWTPWATLVTPPGSPHSHHNEGEDRALFLIVQDGGLHYHARTMGFSFLG